MSVRYPSSGCPFIASVTSLFKMFLPSVNIEIDFLRCAEILIRLRTKEQSIKHNPRAISTKLLPKLGSMFFLKDCFLIF